MSCEDCLHTKNKIFTLIKGWQRELEETTSLVQVLEKELFNLDYQHHDTKKKDLMNSLVIALSNKEQAKGKLVAAQEVLASL